MKSKNMQRKKELQSKFFDREYLSALLNSVEEVRNGDIYYRIYNSNRTNSKTLYIRFYTRVNGVSTQVNSLRISDHMSYSRVCRTFLIYPNCKMKKGLKKAFFAFVNNTIAIASYKRTKFALTMARQQLKGEIENEQ